jgi:hypothetical protein
MRGVGTGGFNPVGPGPIWPVHVPGRCPRPSYATSDPASRTEAPARGSVAGRIPYRVRMSVVSLSVTILRPVGEVFAVLTDVGNAARWSSALEEELLTPGPLRVGSRRRAVVPSVAGRTTENEMELTELIPDRRLAMRGVAGFPFAVRMLAELEPTEGGTLLRWTTWLEPGGVARLVGPVLAASYRRSFGKDLATLKSMMESGTLSP